MWSFSPTEDNKRLFEEFNRHLLKHKVKMNRSAFINYALQRQFSVMDQTPSIPI